jgi:hypothetical protein
MVVTISGEVKPIKWIGKRSYAGQFIASNRAVLPIVVCAGALAPDTPARDLWLSPRHALLIDGILVPVELLINGQTILQAEAVEQVEYFHLEFEAHEVILAEGAPAESYVEYDNRQGFHNAHEFATLYPDDTRASFGYCLPLLEPGTPELAAIRVRLFERAAAHGHLTTADPGLHRRRDRRDGAIDCLWPSRLPHHRADRASGAGGIGTADQLDELARNDVPRDAEAVFYPAALLRLGHCRERVGEAAGRGCTALAKPAFASPTPVSGLQPDWRQLAPAGHSCRQAPIPRFLP